MLGVKVEQVNAKLRDRRQSAPKLPSSLPIVADDSSTHKKAKTGARGVGEGSTRDQRE